MLQQWQPASTLRLSDEEDDELYEDLDDDEEEDDPDDEDDDEEVLDTNGPADDDREWICNDCSHTFLLTLEAENAEPGKSIYCPNCGSERIEVE